MRVRETYTESVGENKRKTMRERERESKRDRKEIVNERENKKVRE